MSHSIMALSPSSFIILDIHYARLLFITLQQQPTRELLLVAAVVYRGSINITFTPQPLFLVLWQLTKHSYLEFALINLSHDAQ